MSLNAPFSCIIADDEEIDRLAVLSLVKRYSFLNVSGVFASAEGVLKSVKDHKPDVLFLDIDMPNLSGLELRGQLMDIPACIFITSYPEYAVESFEKEALDFIVKPVKLERFDKTMERLQQYLSLREKADLAETTLGGDSIMIKEGHDQIKIQKHSILYLEALKDYTRIVTNEKKYCVLSALGNLLKESAFNSFVRIHRSYAVQRPMISRITTTSVVIGDTEIPIGRSYKDVVEDILNEQKN